MTTKKDTNSRAKMHLHTKFRENGSNSY